MEEMFTTYDLIATLKSDNNRLRECMVKLEQETLDIQKQHVEQYTQQFISFQKQLNDNYTQQIENQKQYFDLKKQFVELQEKCLELQAINWKRGYEAGYEAGKKAREEELTTVDEQTVDRRRKISESLKGKRRGPHSTETRRKISKGKKGRPQKRSIWLNEFNQEVEMANASVAHHHPNWVKVRDL